MATLSADLIWEVTRGNSSTLVKRKQAGGQQFSRDRLNVKNRYSRKYEGLVSDKAIGVLPAENGGVTLITKKNDKANSPASQYQSSTFGSSSSSRKIYKSIASSTAKRNYRPDLRKDAVARASAIRKSNKPVKESPEPKARGAKAKKADA
ncbi:60S ribosomal protein-like protein L28 [Lophiotrema nucula]|uniref:60S ribosomal protein-like protein L28 n=1 Tax=Lophiotrema nucula TaxID=690887 RepID=A0A6A5Z7X1_9PLEO|nr:60S ribosomal protein-like protein L28 [Lophiotrema nucula]